MHLPPLSSFTTRSAYLHNQLQTLGRAGFEAFLTDTAGRIGEGRFRSNAADDLLSATRPADLLPEVYAAYRPVVADGIRFILSRLSLPRLMDLIADQAALGADAPAAHRLIRLARRLPTFQKLGQIIARNRHLDSTFRSWLIRLENGPPTIPMAEIEARVREALDGDLARHGVTLGPAPLAEASVSVVTPFAYGSNGGRPPRHGVFKILKPGVRAHLEEELRLLDDLAHHFDTHRDTYRLDRFRFIETIAEVRRILMEEIDLPGEQRHLLRAAAFYNGKGRARVPAVLPFSTEKVTAMAFLEGGKITDAPADETDRCRLARTLFRSLILSPLFSPKEDPPFHGDPHAGNLLALPREGHSAVTRVGLVDWSLSGTLHRRRRIRLMALMRGVVAGDAAAMERALFALSEKTADGPAGTTVIGPAVREITATADYRNAAIVARTFALIDGVTLAGITFPPDLMLFRKAFFTLDGVLADLDPDFDMDVVMTAEILRLLSAEMPQRWIALLLPFADRPERYRTLTSNGDLRWLMGRLLLEIARKGTHLAAGMAIGGVRTLFPFAAFQ